MSAIRCPNCGMLRKVEQVSTPEGWSNSKCWFCGDPGWIQPYDAKDPLAGRGDQNRFYELLGNPVLVPAKALHLIDQIIGNEETISADQLGEVRGIVLDALNMWHNAYPGSPCHERIEINSEMEVKL
jgi:hypothetical protein